jgi:outer membrane protein TolC
VRAGLSAAAALAVLAGGCRSPLAEQAERDLSRAVRDTPARELFDAERTPGTRTTTRSDGAGTLSIRPDLLPELERMAGPMSYEGAGLSLPEDLLGGGTRTVAMTLERAVKSAVEHNIAVQFARLSPALSEQQVIQAEAAFDWTLYSNVTYNRQDSPQVQTVTGGQVFGQRSLEQQSVQTQAGLRRNTISGGRFTIQQDYSYQNSTSNATQTRPDPANNLGWTIQADQPLLRGFGSDVATAEIRLARNAERAAVASLRRDLIRVVSDTERAYWQLALAQRNLQISERLVQRGLEVRDQIRQRAELDARPARIAAAEARVERRRADVLRAQLQVRAASDRLKTLMNDPELPVGSEVVVLTSDRALDQPVEFSLADALRSALLRRPEMEQSLLTIDDTSIRQVVAANARLPQLDLRLQARLAALEADPADAFSEVTRGGFVDYLAGLVFEYPLGNRRADAEFRRRRIERMQAVIAYRNTAQQVVAEVKGALDQVVLNYRLISQTAVSRLAAAEELRALGVEKALREGYTAEQLDLELNRQEALAQTEREEAQALIEYNVAIATLYGATGAALERNRIRFVVPRADEALSGLAGVEEFPGARGAGPGGNAGTGGAP